MTSAPPTTNLYAGFLTDERSVTLSQWAEDMLVKTIADAKTHSEKRRCDFRRSMKMAFNAYVSWGAQEEQRLTEAITKDSPMMDKFLRYAVLKYARCMVTDDTDELFAVRVVMPTIGQFLRDVHVHAGRRPEIYIESFLTDPLKRKMCAIDCTRGAIMQYVQTKVPQHKTSLDPDTISPDDSVSQVGAAAHASVANFDYSMPGAQPSKPYSAVDATSHVEREERGRFDVAGSLFQQTVEQKLQEMTNPEPTPSSVSKPENCEASGSGEQTHDKSTS